MTNKPLKSDTILRQMSDQQYEKKEMDVDEGRISFFIFQLAEYLFAFPDSHARQIVPFTQLTWIPGANAFIPGVVNIGGDIAAVLDVKQILGIAKPGQEATGAYLVMLRSGDERNSILIDNIIDVVEVPASQNKPILPTLNEHIRQFASSQFDYDNQPVTVLDAVMIIEKVNS
ncbi:chemotaxis protein CheW [Sporomusa acidovorans]|uniref:CheW-like domain-containing protein n=1 Tax=Sporomusa acidovorans (strain ATCC 49682 / DSM 3132 / Mol) TaxID=1123286 RepID=A0ABZ3J8B4_SPOA4|nr:chemotaxis protein CheW [Sporomusa acidovorans]OZC16672.1 chemotaxis protein CheW [Sporomusa acidovorans DSM 3132]SDE06616.1 purine-binding chemotaxis protein CheW [Sporomusa acidovorans]